MEEEKTIDIPHVKRKDFASGICDSIVTSANERGMTILFSCESTNILSESFVKSDGTYKPAENPVKAIQTREDLASITLRYETASQLHDAISAALVKYTKIKK
jgi:hypothetical protein